MMLKNKSEIKSWLDKHKIKNYTINSDLSIDVDGSVYLFNKNLIEIPVQFNVVNGYFWCSNNQLTSLEFSPKEIKGSFDCASNKLTSLKGCPEIVDGNFICSNNQLTSLEGLNLKGISGELYIDDYLEEDLIYKQYLLKKKIKELC